ncbi:MAG: WD40 repeat domain-containing protein [Blastochloris sp.]|nr:WD40 repeat domain-containing protein [Blastochloris sp.]
MKSALTLALLLIVTFTTTGSLSAQEEDTAFCFPADLISVRPDGQYLALVPPYSEDRMMEIELYELPENDLVRTIPLNTGYNNDFVRDIIWHDDLMIVRTDTHAVLLVDWDTGETISNLNPLTPITLNDIALSPDRGQLAFGGFGLQVYDMETQEPVAEFATTDTFGDLRWSPDGSMIAVSNIDAGGIQIFDVASGERIADLDVEIGSTENPPWLRIFWEHNPNFANADNTLHYVSSAAPLTIFTYRPSNQEHGQRTPELISDASQDETASIVHMILPESASRWPFSAIALSDGRVYASTANFSTITDLLIPETAARLNITLDHFGTYLAAGSDRGGLILWDQNRPDNIDFYLSDYPVRLDNNTPGSFAEIVPMGSSDCRCGFNWTQLATSSDDLSLHCEG